MIHEMVGEALRAKPWQVALLGAILATGVACKNEGTVSADAPGAAATPVAAVIPAAEEPVEAASPAPEPTLAAAQANPAPEELDAPTDPDAEPMDAPPTSDRPEAEPQGERKVLILGDSLAATGFGALLERRLDEHPGIVCYRKGKSASGLARPDFFDWLDEAKRQVELREPELVVVIMGGNDGQDLTPRKKGSEKRVAWQHEDWAAAYRARMDTFLATVSGPTRRVVWLELPTMGLRSLEKKLELIREVQKQAVAQLGDQGRYVETAAFVEDASGGLLTHAQVGPGGRSEAIRADDRIHFTMAGSQYFADRVYPEVLEALGVADEQPAAAP